MKKFGSLILLISLITIGTSEACTNFLVTKGASVDGSNMITYAADAHVLYGELYYRPAMDYPAGSMMDIIEWDTHKLLGQIKQVKHTYSVVGLMNEHQLTIGETTYGGRKELSNFHSGIVDYGNLMFIALQRAKTAREAIQVMAGLFDEYGYYSSGESFSISDKNEVWIMELIGKGEGQKGALWVAMKIPDGYVCAHANQARITTFDFQEKNDWFNEDQVVFHAPDVISFAREKGWFTGKDKDFSFSDIYAPVGFGGARFCEMRVWSFFKDVNKKMGKYADYASGIIEHGKNDFAKNRMPLWIKPDYKLSAQDLMKFMRDHLEGTNWDMTKDLGAGPWELPYRWRPLTWEVDGVTFCNERATATQQTGFSFVSQSRNWLPDPIGGIHWFGVDDANTTVYAPMYCGMSEVPFSYQVGNGDLLTFNWDAAFWVFNMVANWTYSRYSYIIKDVRLKQAAMENKYAELTPVIDEAAKALYKNNPELAIDFITNYSVNTANNLVDDWRELGQFLFTKYIDGNIKKEKEGIFLRTETGYPVGPDQPGYPDWWLKKIVESSSGKFEVKGSAH
ncbi:MAG: C69 family dipeptidase [Bacteroidetes bacterium]|nr:C69 family dipeptidase [Bacteroidota bacterium]MBL6963245.1 C69 family dipeptidase [Bacteroidota bacterium]